MKKFGVQKSWTLLIKVSYKHFELCRSYFPHPLCMSANNDGLLLGNNSKYQLVLCNLKNNTISNIELPLREVFFISFDYVQSLVLPYRNWFPLSSLFFFYPYQPLKCKASHRNERLNPHCWEPGRPNSCNVTLLYYLFNAIPVFIVLFCAYCYWLWSDHPCSCIV